MRVDQARVERWLGYVRCLGVLFAVPAVATTPYWPSDNLRWTAWLMTAVLAVGTIAFWVVNRRVTSRQGRLRMSLASMSFDLLVVSGYVLVFAYEQPYVTWSLTLVLPIAGALRFGAWGAAVLAFLGIVLFAVQILIRAGHVDEPVLSAQIFASGMIALIAATMAVLVESLERQNAAYREQALQLAEANHVRERLLAVTSHEFRGSLTAIGTSAATVREHRERLSGERADRLLTSIEGQVGQLLRLVDDLLVSAEFSDGVIELEPVWREVKTSVDVALDAASRHRDGHPVEVYVEPLACRFDHDRMSQVLRNLVENAYKYSPSGTPVAVKVEAASDGVLLQVSDHGPGIPAEHRERLFEPYRRGPAEEAAGSGLGLYVVHRIVVAAGGAVDVRSSSSGTSFTVRLPCETRRLPANLRRSDADRPLHGEARPFDAGEGRRE